MIFVFLLGVGVLAAVLSWFLQRSAGQAYTSYRFAFKKQAAEHMSEFFLFLDPAQLWLANLVLCAAAVGLSYLLMEMAWLSGAIGAAALVAPQYSIRRYRRRRMQRFDEQLPDLLMALSGALRAGSGIQAALRHITAQAPVPLAQEFGLLLRQQRIGVSFDQALASLYGRMPTEGTGLVVSSLKIAAQTGGSLSETLERIASTLRARLHLLGRVRSLTSQGRLQAWVMACLPAVLALVLHQLDPESMRLLWETPIGLCVLAAIAVLETAGVLLILRIVDIEV